MKVIALSYASRDFLGYQRIWELTARRAGFDEVLTHGRGDLGSDFAALHAETLAEPRGDGCWLWKPYLVARALETADDGDVVFYSDVTSQFVGSIDPVLSLMEDSGLERCRYHNLAGGIVALHIGYRL